MPGGRRKHALAALAACLSAAAAPAPVASAQQPLGPYDGSNPFRCQLQDVGTGTDFPDPGADPFCVEFDKTQQNVTDFGLVDFLLNEPGRVAAAIPKCFYYQRDHWTGSIVQGETPELWHWDGGYYFDRARGVGGVSARNFRLAGIPMDMTPFVPAAYRPFFDPNGGGGVQVTLATDPDPGCGARVDTPEEREQVYRGVPRSRDCVPPGGELRGTRVGRARLGIPRPVLNERLGPPVDRRRRADRWCLIGKASLRVVYRDAEATLIRTSSRGHALDGIARGDGSRAAIRRFGAADFRLGHTAVLAAGRRPARDAYVGVRGGRVRWVALADPRAIPGQRAAARTLRRTRW